MGGRSAVGVESDIVRNLCDVEERDLANSGDVNYSVCRCTSF